MGEDEFEFGYVWFELTVEHPEKGAWVLGEDRVWVISPIMESDTVVGNCSVEENCVRCIEEGQAQSFAGTFHYRK